MEFRKKDVRTNLVLTDNAPQGLNDPLSSFPLATKVGPPFSFFLLWNNSFFEARSFRLFYALRDSETIYFNL